MRLAFVSQGSPRSLASWSGIPHHALLALKGRGLTIDVVDTPNLDRGLSLANKALKPLGVLPTRDPIVASLYAAVVGRKLLALRPDAVICINAPVKLMSVLGRLPCLVFADTTLGPLMGFYSGYSRVGRGPAGRRVDREERKVIDSDAAYVLSSQWAAQSSADYYGVPISRFEVAPLGPSFSRLPECNSAMLAAPDRLRLLFAGYDWKRKGGPVVLQTFERLRRTWPDAELHIVGAEPSEATGLPGVTLHGRLSKADAVQRRKFEALFTEAAFFFMPSQQEAYGAVYCEACAFGLPSVARDTGGVGTIVQDGVNGLLSPPEAGSEDYANRIDAAWRDREAYLRMRLAARESFETRLNWRAWGDTVESRLRRMVHNRSDRG